MLRKLIILLLCLFPRAATIASEWRNEADSLELVLEGSTSDTGRISIYLNLSGLYLSNEPERAMEYALQAEDLAKQINDKENQVRSMLQQCDFYSMIGEYNTSLQLVYDALELAGDNAELLSWCHNRIATVHDAVGNYRETLTHNKKSLKYSSMVGDSSGIIVDIHNIGRIYTDLGEYDSALMYLHIANDYEIRHKGRPDPYSLSNIGNVYIELGKFDSALYYHLKAYKYDLMDDQKYLVAIDQQFIAKTYFKMGRYDEAKIFALESIKHAESLKAYDVSLDDYEILYQIYTKEGKYKLALDYSIKYNSTRDTLYNKAKQSLLLGLETKYKLKEQADKLALVERQKTLYFVLSIVSILFIISMVIIIFMAYRKQRILRSLTRELQQANASKEQLLSIISHDLRGSVGTLRSAAKLISEGMTSVEESENLLASFYPVADSTYDLLENLLTWTKYNKERITPEITRINLKEAIEKCLEYIQHLANAKTVKLVHYLEDQMVYADKDMLSTILRNIFSNAIKFSHPNSRILIAQQKDDGVAIISVTDHGIGMSSEDLAKLFISPEEVQSSGTLGERGSGLGVMICKTFCEALNGKIWADSSKEKGTTFFLSLPTIKSNQ